MIALFCARMSERSRSTYARRLRSRASSAATGFAPPGVAACAKARVAPAPRSRSAHAQIARRRPGRSIADLLSIRFTKRGRLVEADAPNLLDEIEPAYAARQGELDPRWRGRIVDQRGELDEAGRLEAMTQ